MRLLDANTVRMTVKDLILSVSRALPPDVRAALANARAIERSAPGRDVLSQLLENAAYAEESSLPICQDTGTAVFFVEHGEDLRLEGGGLRETLALAAAEAYREGYLRASMCHPLTRANTGDNSPIVLHVDLVPGDRLRIHFLPKGGGAENMSRLFMLSPSQGWDGVRDCVIRAVEESGSRPCPPILLGVAVGGTFDSAPLLAKKGLLRPLDVRNDDPELAAKEQELLDACNKLGIGPGGLGGDASCLAVRLCLAPCHIASLPVAVNIQCNAARHGSIEL